MQQTMKKPGRLTRLESRKARWGYAFLMPWLIMFCVFYAYPLIYGIVISFTDFKIGSMKWIGVANYVNIFKDYAFWRSLLGTLCYGAIFIPMQVFLPLWAANTIRPHGSKFTTATKLLVYLPGVASAVALIIAWKFVLAPDIGLVSRMFSFFGVERFSVLDSAKTSIPILSVLAAFCSMGGNLIIYSAALNGIPEDYYEAARLDGANRQQQFRNITIPMLQPTMVYVFITSTIAALQIFVIPQLMTGGGPNYTSSSLLILIYNSAFQLGKFGYASAIGVILFVLTAMIALIQFRVTKRDSIEY